MAVSSLIAAAPSQVHADDDQGDHDDGACRFFDGPFVSNLVPPPTCTSPVHLCTHGQLQGDFPAGYDFTFVTLQSANDPSDPTEFVYTGHSTVTTDRGVIQTNDSGVLHLAASGPSPFVTTASIAHGTGRYTGATGVFVATGTLDSATGEAAGSFIAHVCRAAHDQ